MRRNATTLRTRRLTVRSPERADAGAITALVSEWDVARMTARIPFPGLVADAHRWLEARRFRLASVEIARRRPTLGERLWALASAGAAP
jgi:hypothetical protein